MDPKAIVKARRRLRVAEQNAEALKSAPDHDTFADKWYMFLHAAKGIYTTLEQGAKATAQARQWFGAKNQERKSDPLLRYISEARNDDEHGLEEAIEVTSQSLLLGVAAPGASTVMRDQFGNTFVGNGVAMQIRGGHPNMPGLPRLTALDGKPIKTAFIPERMTLKAVRDRSGHVYQPPRRHLGRELGSDRPEEVATLAIAYLQGLLSDAEGL